VPKVYRPRLTIHQDLASRLISVEIGGGAEVNANISVVFEIYPLHGSHSPPVDERGSGGVLPHEFDIGIASTGPVITMFTTIDPDKRYPPVGIRRSKNSTALMY